MRSAVFCAMLFSLTNCSLGARILAIFIFPGKSHFIFFSAILKALTQRGHHVVEYSPFPPNQPISNHTHIEIHTDFEKAVENWTYEDFLGIMNDDQPTIGVGFSSVWAMTSEVCEEALKHAAIQQLLNSQEHFDLVITEATFGQESLLVFGHKFAAPTVSFQGFQTWSVINRAAGNALSVAPIPDVNSLVATDRMSFKERLLNLISVTLTLFYYYNHHLPRHDKLIKQHYFQDVPPLADMVSNISLYLVNTHPFIEYSHPYTANIVPIAGITSSPERTPLPQNIQKFMDEAKEGVIFFSLGTVVPAEILPKEIFQIFVNVFKKLPYKVLWKIQLERIPGLSSNVMLTKWVPQPGVLAHPNCILFITHGGLFSQQEAVYAGVPTVGIPFFGDQKFNVRFSEDRGFGLKLDFTTLSELTLKSTLDAVLNNPKYKENAQRLSRIFHDRQVSPADSAVFWVEYVLRHGGAHHLRPAAAQLPWYQLTLLDVVAAIVAAFFTTIIILYLVFRKILSLIFKKNKVVKAKKKD